jgi:copper chaperone
MAETIRIEVPEIHCDHCKRSIEEALLTLPGVLGADVDVERRTVTAEVDDVHGRRAAVVAAIEAQGYEVPEAHAAREEADKER